MRKNLRKGESGEARKEKKIWLGVIKMFLGLAEEGEYRRVASQTKGEERWAGTCGAMGRNSKKSGKKAGEGSGTNKVSEGKK